GYGDIRALDNVADIFSGADVRRKIIGQQPFETNVLRNIGKYPDIKGTNNIPLARYEEVILNYAEALFELGDNSEATAQLNLIASNRGATPYAKVTKEDILAERRKELMFEGFIFDDLMRTKKGIPKVSEQQSKQYPISYGDSRLALPIPIGEINSNPNMVQNHGY
ncbi:MAG: RagB/SusD family nutrient uptake outer membrane protein, partial [Candidatus Nephrothrix sp. EaCA]